MNNSIRNILISCLSAAHLGGLMHAASHKSLQELCSETITYNPALTAESMQLIQPQTRHLAWSSLINESLLYRQRDTMRTIEAPSPIACLTYSPSASLIASASRTNIFITNAITEQPVYTVEAHNRNVTSIAFNPRNEAIIASTSKDGTVKIWDISTGMCKHTLEGHERGARVVAFSPDGQSFATGGCVDGLVHILDTATGVCRRTLTNFNTEHPLITDLNIRSLAFSPDGTTIAIGSAGGTIRLFNLLSGAYLHTFEGHGYIDNIAFFTNSSPMAFSPDGKTLASGSSDKIIRLRDIHTGECKRTLHGHESRIHSLSFSPDGRNIYSTSPDKTVRKWDTKTGAILNVLRLPTNDWVNATSLDAAQQTLSMVTQRNEYLPYKLQVLTLSYLHNLIKFAEDDDAQQFLYRASRDWQEDRAYFVSLEEERIHARVIATMPALNSERLFMLQSIAASSSNSTENNVPPQEPELHASQEARSYMPLATGGSVAALTAVGWYFLTRK